MGKIATFHGEIETPAFVPVATKGTLKSLTPKQVKEVGVKVAFVNCYHLVTHPGVEIIEKAGGIHGFSKLEVPLMSDSGGFQVFSLATGKRKAKVFGEEEPLVEKISEDGVKFRSTYDGTLVEFTPEKSIEYQKKIGADLIMAFDECLDCGADHVYAKKSMERTHEWLKRCIRSSTIDFRISNIKNQKFQFLYGIIQGGKYENLRKESAKFVVSQNTDGVAIGGVSVGETKEEMRQQVSWVSEYLPEDKPVHLLGVGHADDILDLVGYGIDTFDCVEPTRLARMGTIYQIQISNFKFQRWEKIDINKTIYKDNLERVDENCECYVCQNFTKAYLYHLFKQKELLGYTLATYHNLWVMKRFMESVRESIRRNEI
ncbi:MAG: tRNA guanosine(34) transglycosylase Tgt [Candidatus Roizmanbacteria bacterium]|nr:MAG: tRNA guanosine(34) transglycosylase Tgt [Candidatus Roizmanbacteria bacterium]